MDPWLLLRTASDPRATNCATTIASISPNETSRTPNEKSFCKCRSNALGVYESLSGFEELTVYHHAPWMGQRRTPSSFIPASCGLNSPYRQLGSSRCIRSLLAGIREQYGIHTIWRSDKGAIKQLTSQLKQGNIIAALIDQDTRVKSTFTPFFGRPAKTPSSLVALGRRHNALFISAFIFRTGWRTFSLFIEPFTDEASEEEILNLYNARLEQYIRLYPDQWVWFHKRWRTETNGNTLSSSQYLSFLEKQLTQSDDVRY
jgi:hypothetical protein